MGMLEWWVYLGKPWGFIGSILSLGKAKFQKEDRRSQNDVSLSLVSPSNAPNDWHGIREQT